MTMVTWAKKNSRAIGKLALYGTGGVLLGWPVVKFGLGVYKGQSMEGALNDACVAASGYSTINGTMDNTKLRDAAIRDLIGAGCILAARKI